MEFSIFFLTTFVVCFLNIGSIHSMPEDTMDTWKSKIDVNDPSWDYSSSGRLKSHSGSYYTPNRHKELIISAPRGYSIFAAFRTVDLRPNRQDSIRLYENGKVGAGALLIENEHSYKKIIYDSREEKITYFAKDGQLVVAFDTGPGSTSGYKGFDMYYTVQANWTKCLSKHFKCNNGQCIAKSLKCDGHNHCGDRSDQRNCIVLNFGVGKITGVTIGVIFLIVAAACAIYIICRRRTRTEVRTVINHPPPPTYPQSTQYPPPPPPYSYNQGAPNPGFR